ncbi:MAG: hypothetical protein ACRC1K_08005 [Planctomycetia bacterium]
MIVGLALTLVLAATNAEKDATLARDSIVDAVLAAAGPSLDITLRNRVLDDALASSSILPAGLAGSSRLPRLLSPAPADSFQAGARCVDCYTNPEPSSMLVWSTTLGGLFAAGYGYRRRLLPSPI